MAGKENNEFFLPDFTPKTEKSWLSNEEVFKKLIAAEMNLCFSRELKDRLDYFFNNCEGADVCGYKIVRLTLTDDMQQLMGELAISIAEKLENPLLNDHITAISENIGKELRLRMAFNHFFEAIGERSKILLVLTNFYEHLANISQADVLRLQSFLEKCKQCRLWICGDGEWYKGKHSVFLNLYRVLDPIYDTYFDALKKDEKLPTVYISYRWKGESIDIVDTLYDLFKRKQIYYKRDRQYCRYGDNITDFMDEIRAGRFVVVVFSESYLKSFNCLYELSGILEHPDYMKRVFPLVIDESVRGSNKYEKFVDYWEGKKGDDNLIAKRITRKNEEAVLPLERKIALITEYVRQLPKLEEVLDEMNSYTYNDLKSCNFEPLLYKIKERMNI